MTFPDGCWRFAVLIALFHLADDRGAALSIFLLAVSWALLASAWSVFENDREVEEPPK